jgi:hypothetical protein
MLTALSAIGQEVWPADALSRTAITRNQQSLALVKPCALEMTWKPDPAQAKYSTVIIKYKGTSVFIDWQRPNLTGHPELRGPGQIRAVLNDAYIAFTSTDSPGMVSQIEPHGGPKSTQTVLSWKQRLPRDPLTFPFGNGEQTLQVAIDSYFKALACVAEETTDDTGRRVVRMKVYPKNDSGPSDARWVYDFDPDRGYAITRVAAMLGLNPFVEYQVELQPGERPGTWLPRHISRPNPPGNGEPEEIDVRILPGADLSDACFRIGALNRPADDRMARTLPDGLHGSLVYLVDGVWVSDPSAGRLNPTAQSAPKVGAVGSSWAAIIAAGIFVCGVALFIYSRSRRRGHRS